MPPRSLTADRSGQGGFRALFAGLFGHVASQRAIIGDGLAGRSLGGHHATGRGGHCLTRSGTHGSRRGLCGHHRLGGCHRRFCSHHRCSRSHGRLGGFCGLCSRRRRRHGIGRSGMSSARHQAERGKSRCKTKKRHRSSPKKTNDAVWTARNIRNGRFRMARPWRVHDIRVTIGPLHRNAMVQRAFMRRGYFRSRHGRRALVRSLREG
jgi:hypothetical protein